MYAYVEMVEEPNNPALKVSRAPTIYECDCASVPVKHNFSYRTFYIPVFKGLSHITQMWENFQAKKNKDGNSIHEGGIRNKGCLNPWIVNKYKLTPETIPEGFSDIFVPFLMNNPKGNKDVISIQLIIEWTKLKANISNIGPVGACYLNFHPFSAR